MKLRTEPRSLKCELAILVEYYVNYQLSRTIVPQNEDATKYLEEVRADCIANLPATLKRLRA